MEKRRKTLQELTILDGFMFGAVMMDPENCRGLLERILEMPIGRVEVVREKCLIYHPEYKGVRLDVYAADETGTRYDVEMQVRKTPVEKRSRYYHSQMDMELLLSGTPYDQLPDSYVIFICDYDPFGQGKYRYCIKSRCHECPEMEVADGVHTVILNNCGNNPEEVSAELVNFLQYTKKTLPESEEYSEDNYIRKLQESIREIKGSREMGERYMTLQEMLQEERKEGLQEGERLTVIRLIKKGRLTMEEGAAELGLTMEDLGKLMKDSAEES